MRKNKAQQGLEDEFLERLCLGGLKKMKLLGTAIAESSHQVEGESHDLYHTLICWGKPRSPSYGSNGEYEFKKISTIGHEPTA